MDLGLTGRSALVAGASRGLGRACAEALAAEGARVAICAREEGPLETARAEIAAATGAEIVAFVADVSTADGATGFVRLAAETLGGCDVLVANAGGPRPGSFDEMDDGEFAEAFELTFQSSVRMTREALPHMRSGGYGRVIVIGSYAMKAPLPNLVLSNAFRAGLAGWAKTLSREVAKDGITVNAILPDRVMTERTRALAGHDDAVLEALAREVPLGRLGEPADVGSLCAFLASERAAYLTGGFYLVDGGRYPGLF